MAAKYKATFETRVGNANFGKIVFDIDSDSFGASTNFEFEVTAPDGTVIKEADGTADYTLPGVLPGGWISDVFEVDIPLAGTQYMKGTYIISVTEDDGDTTSTENFYYCGNTKPDGTSIVGTLTPAVNCEQAQLVITDDTDHDGWTILARSLIIVPPTIPGQAAPTAITSTDDSYDISFTYTNVYYTASNTVTRTKTTSGTAWDFIQNETITSSANQFIDCGQGICQIATCFDTYTYDLDAKAQKAGGYGNLPDRNLGDTIQYMLWIENYRLLSQCGEFTKANRYRDLLLANFPCDCGCGESAITSSTPKPYAP